jgi:hypothetical protein
MHLVSVLALASFAVYLVLWSSVIRHRVRCFWFEISRFVLFLGIMALIAIVPLPWR